MGVAVLDSPVMIGLSGGSGHHNVDFTSWHKFFLWHGKIFVHNPSISVFGPSGDSLGQSMVLRVEPPLVGVFFDKVGITTVIVKHQFASHVGDLTGLLIPGPSLSFVSRLFWLNDNITFLDCKDHWVSSAIGFLKMEPHAFSWLHSGGYWLFVQFSEVWGSVALNDFNIEVNVSVKRDWLSAKR